MAWGAVPVHSGIVSSAVNMAAWVFVGLLPGMILVFLISFSVLVKALGPGPFGWWSIAAI